MKILDTLYSYLNNFNTKNKFNRDVFWNIGALFILGFVGLANNSIMKGVRGNYGLGLFSIVYAIYIILSQLAAGGVHLSVLKNISYNQDSFEKCSEIYTSGLIYALIVSSIVAILTFLLKHQIASLTKNPEDIAVGLAIIAPAFVFFSFNKILLNVLNGVRKMRSVAVFQSLRIILICIGILSIIVLGFEDKFLVFGLTFAEIVLFFILFFYVWRNVKAPILSKRIFFWMPEHFDFSMKSVLSGVLFNINIRIDQLMLSHFFEADIVGIYTFASFFVEGINEVAHAVRKNVDPLLGGLFANKKLRTINYLVFKVKKNFTPLMIFIFFASIIGFPVLGVFVGYDKGFYSSWGVLAILMVGVLYSGRIRPFYWVLIQGGKPEAYTLVMVIVVFLNIAVNYLLIPIWGVFGAATATTLVFISQALLIRYFSKKLLKVVI